MVSSGIAMFFFFSFVGELVPVIFEQFLVFFNKLQSGAVYLLDLPVIENIVTYVQLLVGGLIGIKILYDIIMTHFLRMNGDKQLQVHHFLFRSIYAVFIVSFMPFIIKYMWNFGSSVSSDIQSLQPTVEEIKGFFQDSQASLMHMLNMQDMHVLLSLISVIVALLLMILIWLQMYIRNIELAMYMFIGMFTAIGLNENPDAMSPWYKKILVLCFSQAVQMFLLKVSFVLLLFPQTNQAGDIFQQFLLFLACLYFTFQAPSSLEGYLANTGFTKALDSGVKAVSNIGKVVKIFK